MNVRLKLANKEQKTCTNKMAENSSESEADRVVEEAGAEDLTVEGDTEVYSGEVDVGKTEPDPEEENDEESTSEHSASESDEDPTDEKKQELVSKISSPTKKKSIEHKESASEGLNKVKEHITDEEQKQLQSDEIKSKPLDKDNKDSPSSSSDESAHDDEKSDIVSKLDADALSASLSSSKCLLKRNRDDLDTDDDDSGEEEEEPFSKKSHIREEVTPKHVSKLKSSELLASMSSSKSLLKRGIEKVDKANTEEATDAPESKKSNLAQTPKPEEKEESLENATDESTLKHRKEIVTLEETKPIEVRIAPKTLKFPLSPICQIPAVKSLLPNPLSREPERLRSGKEESPVKEETRQKIGAKELAGQRQLERKRLNKMLAIFDDQKIVK